MRAARAAGTMRATREICPRCSGRLLPRPGSGPACDRENLSVGVCRPGESSAPRPGGPGKPVSGPVRYEMRRKCPPLGSRRSRSISDAAARMIGSPAERGRSAAVASFRFEMRPPAFVSPASRTAVSVPAITWTVLLASRAAKRWVRPRLLAPGVAGAVATLRPLYPARCRTNRPGWARIPAVLRCGSRSTCRTGSGASSPLAAPTPLRAGGSDSPSGGGFDNPCHGHRRHSRRCRPAPGSSATTEPRW